jgi:3-methyladenine DNA glycosylase AlkD
MTPHKPSDHISTLLRALEKHQDPDVQSWWEDYVKDSAPFLGVRMSVIRTTVHIWHESDIGNELDEEQQFELAYSLILAEHNEAKLAGVLFLQEILIPNGAIGCRTHLDRFAGLFRPGGIYDWNVCDWFCVKVLGTLIGQDGKQCAKKVSEWCHAGNLWQARSAVVPFTTVAEESDFYPMVKDSSRVLIRRDERFAKTAVGWILREISKYDPHLVMSFIDANLAHFSTESLRNAMKYFDKSIQKGTIARLRGLPSD